MLEIIIGALSIGMIALIYIWLHQINTWLKQLDTEISEKNGFMY